MFKSVCRGLALFFLLLKTAETQTLAVMETIYNTAGVKTDIPVSIDLDAVTFLNEDSLELLQIRGENLRPVPFQVKTGEVRSLHWLLHPEKNKDNYTYELHKSKSLKMQPMVKYKRQKGLLTIYSGTRDLLGYQFETVYPPAGVDSSFQRNAFIHPLWSPKGQVLTRIQPPDHYHHYGIWNPWTHVLFEGDTLDFWNLAKKQGTVRFDGFLSLEEGPVFAEINAVHKHVAFKMKGLEKVVLNELQTIRVYNPQDSCYIVDFIVSLNCASDSVVKLLEYRYGGFGWRATGQWDKNNSEMLSSEGKTRVDIDNTNGRWFYVQGRVDNEYAGALMMSYPANFNQPQPMRMWGVPEEDRGDVFASFSPTRDKDWVLMPGKSYTLRYRFVVYNGHFNAGISENIWHNYVNPPIMNVRKTGN